MKIFNGTPHTINIIDQKSCSYDEKIRKWVTATIPQVTYIIPSNGMVSAQIDEDTLDAINGMPCKEKTIKGIDILPDGYDLYIVSAIYAAAILSDKMTFIADPIETPEIFRTYMLREHIYTIADPVYNPEGDRVIGCLGIMKPLK